jgi:Flp pilus assembly protein CpaB
MNVMEKIKKLLLNRNTVTILGVLAGVIALWFAYSITLDKAVKPTRVPVAVKDIPAGSIITKDDIEYVDINRDVLKKASIITSSSQLINYYVNNNTSVTKGSMFYTSQVVKKDELIDRDLEIIPENYKIYWLSVDNTTTYANSIYPGDKIDLWLLTKVENNYVYEPFITNIEVLSVKDSKGQNVFDVNSGRTPAVLAFAVPNDIFVYLSKVGFLSGMSLYPVPINKNNADKDATTEISNKELQTLIDSKSIITNPDNTENNE